jgi:hypothetical protein
LDRLFDRFFLGISAEFFLSRRHHQSIVVKMGSTFALVSLCLAGFAAAHHPQSVTTAMVKTAFESSGIIPEVIPSLDPLVSFYGAYTNQAGVDKLLTPGINMIPSGKELEQ